MGTHVGVVGIEDVKDVEAAAVVARESRNQLHMIEYAGTVVSRICQVLRLNTFCSFLGIAAVL
jgi:hypothetical protein